MTTMLPLIRYVCVHIRWILFGMVLGCLLAWYVISWIRNDSDHSLPMHSTPSNMYSASIPPESEKKWISEDKVRICSAMIGRVLLDQFPSARVYETTLQRTLLVLCQKLNNSEPLPIHMIFSGLLVLISEGQSWETCGYLISKISSLLSYCGFGISASAASAVSAASSKYSFDGFCPLENYNIDRRKLAVLSTENIGILKQELERYRTHPEHLVCAITLEELMQKDGKLVPGVTVIIENQHCFFYKTDALNEWIRQGNGRNPATRSLILNKYELS